MNQRDFGHALDSSQRTAQRWELNQATVYEAVWKELARLLTPVDLDLAEEVAAMAGATLLALGLVDPPPPAAPVLDSEAHPGRSHAAADLVDVVLLAAAHAFDGSPRPLRPVLHAAFKRAREMGLSIEEVEAALAPQT